MFACQNFLQKRCRKFYKEQKLFYGHLTKMTTSSSKSVCNAVFGAVLAQPNLAKSRRQQFARSFLEASHLSIYADLALAPVDNFVELS